MENSRCDDDRHYMAEAELTYFDKSRRTFLKVSGLAVAGLFLPQAFPGLTQAGDGVRTVDIVEAVAWGLQDAGARTVTSGSRHGSCRTFRCLSTGSPEKILPMRSMRSWPIPWPAAPHWRERVQRR